MKIDTLKMIVVAFIFAIFPLRVYSNLLGAFWLGIDAKVETDVNVNQKVLDTINNLPIELRKQIVIAGNELINKADESLRSNVDLLSEKLLALSLQAAIDWECTGKNVIDKFFSDMKGVFPRFIWFSDSCEKKYLPDKLGPGPEEKVYIAECWVYEQINKETSPDVIAAKLSTLELMSNDAACRLRGTQASKGMWTKKADFGVRYSVWNSLRNRCDGSVVCEQKRFNEVNRMVNEADKRDISNANEYVESGRKRITSGEDCDFRCYEMSLVDYHRAEATVSKNRDARIRASNREFNISLTAIKNATENAKKAKKGAAKLKSFSLYRESVELAENQIATAASANKKGHSLDPDSLEKYQKINKSIDAIKKSLTEAASVFKSTQAAEERRLAEEERKKRERINEQIRMDRIDMNWRIQK